MLPLRMTEKKNQPLDLKPTTLFRLKQNKTTKYGGVCWYPSTLEVETGLWELQVALSYRESLGQAWGWFE